MIELTIDVLSTILVSFVMLAVLDYLFGIDKLSKPFQGDCDNNVIAAIYFYLMTPISILHGVAHYFDSDIGKAMTLGPLIIGWAATWIFYTCFYIGVGIYKFRSYNVNKRKKPH